MAQIYEVADLLDKINVEIYVIDEDGGAEFVGVAGMANAEDKYQVEFDYDEMSIILDRPRINKYLEAHGITIMELGDSEEHPSILVVGIMNGLEISELFQLLKTELNI
ncbi:hypothetical protein [Periweissella fabalis]|uniref:Uncharacterized protein n=1 Tax=Periweissella fabalis TaxID=1070421 RepID=A0A7X6N0L4_9LACO|nr:hypothetical protein [Periweissella fabalis]MCM0599297.1 hypothetical protein [Periweissella fabalis]NKZ23576.1 hypothetical protein [Periweissella fabalis]